MGLRIRLAGYCAAWRGQSGKEAQQRAMSYRTKKSFIAARNIVQLMEEILPRGWKCHVWEFQVMQSSGEDCS